VDFLAPDQIYLGDCRELLMQIEPGSADLVVTSPPFGVGKSYEAGVSTEQWESLLMDAVAGIATVLRPGGFLMLNLADIRYYPALEMGQMQTEYVHWQRSPVTKEAILDLLAREPWLSEAEIARRLGTSAQTVARRLRGHLARGRSGGPKRPPTRVRLLGGLVETFATDAGLFLMDERVWAKGPNWHGSPDAASGSYRGVDEWEHLFFFVKPGPLAFKPERLTANERSAWGDRSLWFVPSVSANRLHPAMWPIEIPRRAIKMATFPGDLIVDCFCGSGQSLLAAQELGRHYIGIDAERAYVDLARERLRARS
jgi:site-specific DNA-methyltransferase (adenine-specific)